MKYEIRARCGDDEYIPIDWADTDEKARGKVTEYTALFGAGWRVWYIYTGGAKSPRVRAT